MGVIGRLDDQVNEVIIKPVGASKRQEEEETPKTSRESASQPEPPDKQSSTAQHEENARAPQSELPVWLL